MNFFEKTLHKVFAKVKISDTYIVGNTCYGKLTEKPYLRMKAKFKTNGTSCQYEVLEVTIINCNVGVIDSICLHFSDIFGKQQINRPGYENGAYPNIYKHGQDDIDWNLCHPTDIDYDALSHAVSMYLDVFR